MKGTNEHVILNWLGLKDKFTNIVSDHLFHQRGVIYNTNPANPIALHIVDDTGTILLVNTDKPSPKLRDCRNDVLRVIRAELPGASIAEMSDTQLRRVRGFDAGFQSVSKIVDHGGCWILHAIDGPRFYIWKTVPFKSLPVGTVFNFPPNPNYSGGKPDKFEGCFEGQAAAFSDRRLTAPFVVAGPDTFKCVEFTGDGYKALTERIAKSTPVLPFTAKDFDIFCAMSVQHDDEPDRIELLKKIAGDDYKPDDRFAGEWGDGMNGLSANRWGF